MWLPPYFGNYEEFLRALLHNPFLGSERGGPHPALSQVQPMSATSIAAGPQPIPWAVPFLISAVSAKDTASSMSNKEAAKQVVAAAEGAISQFLDDYCGTPPRVIPWPYPGPPPWVSEIASQLTAVANTMQEGNLRTGLIQLAGQVLDKGMTVTAAAARA